MQKISINDIDFSALDSETIKKYGFDPETVDTSSDKFRAGYIVGLVNLLASKNASFAAALSNAKTVEEKYAVCSKVFDVSFETFKWAIDVVTEEMRSSMYKNEKTGELSDEALDMVAGGSKSGWNEFWDDTTNAVCIVAGGALAITGAALAVCSSGLGAPIGLWLATTGAELCGLGIDEMTGI